MNLPGQGRVWIHSTGSLVAPALTQAVRDDCLLWTGRRHPKGYGIVGGKYAHRAAFEAAVGPIPAGMHVLHHCDNPPCVTVASLGSSTVTLWRWL